MIICYSKTRKNWKISKCIVTLFVILFVPISGYAQNKLKGKVLQSSNNSPIIGANVYLKNNPNIGTGTDINGQFVLELSTEEQSDTLIISNVGYKKKEVPLSSLKLNRKYTFHLSKDVSKLGKVTVTANSSLAEEFSTKKISRIAIHTSPVAKNDPLKAITFLPSSTNASENANPELRGSAGDYSRVILNGAPLYKPVRNAQLNGLGNFSILNTDLIDGETVYAGNPPLRYGNSIAGLVEVKTRDQLTKQKLKIDGGLIGGGALYETPIGDERTFLQIFGNGRFSDLYLHLNKKNSPQVNNFDSQDIGLNFHTPLSKHLSANTYSYFINNSYNAANVLYNYTGNMNFNKKRYFNVFNLEYQISDLVVSFNNEVNVSSSKYSFGNIRNNMQEHQFYNALNIKYIPIGGFSFAAGVADNYFDNKFNENLPAKYFAVFPDDSTFRLNHRKTNHNAEAFAYSRYTSGKVVLGAGVRKNIPVEDQKGYLSYQGSIRYNFFSHSSIHISAGKYNGYTVPEFRIQEFDHISSRQYSIGYRYKSNNSNVGIAFYKKNEKIPIYLNETGTSNKIERKIKGLEIYARHQTKHFLFSSSYTWLNSNFKHGGNSVKSTNDINYLVKATVSYNNANLFNCSVNYITRPGYYFTPIVGGEPAQSVSGFKPIFGALNSKQLDNYSRIGFTVSKLISVANILVIPYLSLTNILNKKNQQTPIYTQDYQSISNYFKYQQRLIYFGVRVSI